MKTKITAAFLFLMLGALALADSNYTYIQGPALIESFSTTATAAGTTTLTAASNTTQEFTGSSTQNVLLPDATTLQLGRKFVIINKSSGNVTIKDNGSNTLFVLMGNTQISYMLKTKATANGTWIQGVVSAPISGALSASLPVRTDGSSNLTTGTTSLATEINGTLAVANGGTGATTAVAALSALGGSPLAGSASLTTTGTITSGTWSGGVIATTYGGTGTTTSTGSGAVMLAVSPSSTGTFSAARGYFSGNVGIGTTSPGTSLDISGSLAIRMVDNSSTSTPVTELSTSGTSFVRMTGNAAITISGIDNWAAGKRVVINNTTGNTLTIQHNGTYTGGAKPIYCPGSTDFSISASGSAEVIYDSGSGVWKIISK